MDGLVKVWADWRCPDIPCPTDRGNLGRSVAMRDPTLRILADRIDTE